VVDEPAILQRFEALAPTFNERTRRLWAAAEALAIGRGGVTTLSRLTGISRRAIHLGLKEIHDPSLLSGQIRRPGAGRKKVVDQDASLKTDLEGLVEPVTRGDPESPLRWTCKSVRRLTAELQRMGHIVGRDVVGALLHHLGYSLQANQKTREGGTHVDRDAQFAYINQRVQEQVAAGEPAISVDTKKKELVGDFKNPGREWQPKGQPEQVRVYDFVIPELGKASPYGIYDLANNSGWVNVGIDHDTAEFAVESIRRWWRSSGCELYPNATSLLITADGGGSNGSRVRLWKWELQKLADETGLQIGVSHLPPGTSKWNKIEHRLFAFISMNWRGKPLTSHAIILKLIAATTTTTGLTVQSQLDTNTYPTGIVISDEQLAQLRIQRDLFHGEWNYIILPRMH
jgi:Rhodopirellula transposase DDE domain